MTLIKDALCLMVFILEHIPKVVRQLKIDTNDMPSATFQLVLRWLDQLSQLTWNYYSRPSVSQLLQLFGQLTHDEDATPLSSLRKTRTRSEASVGGNSGGDSYQIDEVEQLFARLPAQL